MVARTLDRFYPVGIALICTALFTIYRTIIPIGSMGQALFSSALNIAAVAIGFLASSQAILFAISGSAPIQWLKDANRYDSLIAYLMEAIYASIFLGVTSAANLMIQPSSRTILVALWIFTSCWALLACQRLIRLMNIILRKI